MNADNLVVDRSMEFRIGGEEEKFDLKDKKNVIQASSPSKNPQDIDIPEIQIDLGNATIHIITKFASNLAFAKNHCRFIGTKKASTLVQSGKGGIPESPSDPSSISFDKKRLDNLNTFAN